MAIEKAKILWFLKVSDLADMYLVPRRALLGGYKVVFRGFLSLVVFPQCTLFFSADLWWLRPFVSLDILH